MIEDPFTLAKLASISAFFRTSWISLRSAAALDIAKGGVLLALPALLVCGLLHDAGEYFRLPKGFYGLKTIFLLLAFMALAGSNRSKRCAITRRASGANCWASTVHPKCAPCASSSNNWLTKTRPSPGVPSFAESG